MMEDNNDIVYGIDFAKPGSDRTIVAVKKGKEGAWTTIGADPITPEDFSEHIKKDFRSHVNALCNIFNVPRNDINYTEDAEFEIIEPKQLPDVQDI